MPSEPKRFGGSWEVQRLDNTAGEEAFYVMKHMGSGEESPEQICAGIEQLCSGVALLELSVAIASIALVRQ